MIQINKTEKTKRKEKKRQNANNKERVRTTANVIHENEFMQSDKARDKLCACASASFTESRFCRLHIGWMSFDT